MNCKFSAWTRVLLLFCEKYYHVICLSWSRDGFCLLLFTIMTVIFSKVRKQISSFFTLKLQKNCNRVFGEIVKKKKKIIFINPRLFAPDSRNGKLDFCNTADGLIYMRKSLVIHATLYYYYSFKSNNNIYFDIMTFAIAPRPRRLE